MIKTKEKAETKRAPARRWRNMWEVRTPYVCALTGVALSPGDRYLSPPSYSSAEIAEQRALDEAREPQFSPHLGVLDDLYVGPVALGGDA